MKAPRVLLVSSKNSRFLSYFRAVPDGLVTLPCSRVSNPDLLHLKLSNPAPISNPRTLPPRTKPRLLNPPFLRCQILHLAVSALIKAPAINELEGGSLLGMDALQAEAPDLPMGARTSYDDSAIAGAAFKVLRQVRGRPKPRRSISGKTISKLW